MSAAYKLARATYNRIKKEENDKAKDDNGQQNREDGKND